MPTLLSYNLGKKGQLSLPGISAASKTAVEKLLLKDAEEHHCFFNLSGFHNHLSHHILAAYDLGAPVGLLKKIYETEAKDQRPVVEDRDKNIVVDETNWTQYLGNKSAYKAFLTFFSEKIACDGASATLEKYVFSEDACLPGRDMLTRLVSGAVHPFIQIGYGAEFGDDTLIATGLAQTCVHVPTKGTVTKIDKNPPETTDNMFELLRRLYDSEVLKPREYFPDSTINTKLERVTQDGGSDELAKISALYRISDTISNAELEEKLDECIWVATLLMAATGRKGRKPRLDFFFMHFVTSSIFLKPICAVLRKVEHKASLLRTYISVMLLFILARGRPRIDPELLMSYTEVPRPPKTPDNLSQPSEDAIGNPLNDEDYNPWPALIQSSLYHRDSHVVKAIRTLAYAARHLGDTAPGSLRGTFSEKDATVETHPGLKRMDGSIFVRAAGLVMETQGWLGHGQKAGKWDTSALGWDAAWEAEDVKKN